MRMAPLGSLSRDSRGASVIEFGLFAPILAVMVMGISDVAMGYSAKLQVEQAVYRALEKVAVGTVQSDYQYLRNEAAAADGSGGIQASNVTVENWLECNRVRQTTFTALCPTGQDTARYVSVSVSWSYTPQFSYGPLVGNSSGVVPISASASLRIQ
jgi:Flp pilus assembly protein TadG